MARSIDTIFNLIIAEKEATTELSGLNSTSQTAIFRLWAWVTATVIYTVEVIFDLFKVEITTLLLALKPGSLPWYQEMCKAFQYGDSLQWIDGKYGYATIDEAKKIVKQCSVNEGNLGLVIKVAAEISGELQPLSDIQLAAFISYISRRKYAGTRISIVNSAANKILIRGTIVYDPLIFKSDGTNIATGQRTVDIAIQNYLRNLPFNGILKITSLVDAIQVVEGVVDVIGSVDQQYGDGEYQEIWASHIPESGYFKIDPAFPLINSLGYQANV